MDYVVPLAGIIPANHLMQLSLQKDRIPQKNRHNSYLIHGFPHRGFDNKLIMNNCKFWKNALAEKKTANR